MGGKEVGKGFPEGRPEGGTGQGMCTFGKKIPGRGKCPDPLWTSQECLEWGAGVRWKSLLEQALTNALTWIRGRVGVEETRVVG